jgi:hypothetical protein
VKNGMVFDPESMTWRGNDDEEDIFEEIEDLDAHKSFSVQDEFMLSPELIKSFKDYEEQHNIELHGWSGVEADKTGRAHLSAIRGVCVICLYLSSSCSFFSYLIFLTHFSRCR